MNTSICMMHRQTPQMLKKSGIKKGDAMNYLAFIDRIVHVCVEKQCWKATWRNWRERRGACSHCGQLNEYPTLLNPLLPIPLSPIISFHISSWYQFIFVYFSFKNLILHIFCIIMIIIRCSGMFRNVLGCSGMFHVRGFIDSRYIAILTELNNS